MEGHSIRGGAATFLEKADKDDTGNFPIFCQFLKLWHQHTQALLLMPPSFYTPKGSSLLFLCLLVCFHAVRAWGLSPSSKPVWGCSGSSWDETLSIDSHWPRLWLLLQKPPPEFSRLCRCFWINNHILSLWWALVVASSFQDQELQCHLGWDG